MTKQLEKALIELKVLESSTEALSKILPNSLGASVLDYILLGEHVETLQDNDIEPWEELTELDILTREDIEFNLEETLKEGGEGELEKEALATDHDYFEYVEMGAYLNVRTDKALEVLEEIIKQVQEKLNEPKKEVYRFTVSYDMACEIDVEAYSYEEAREIAENGNYRHEDMFEGILQVDFMGIVD